MDKKFETTKWVKHVTYRDQLTKCGVIRNHLSITARIVKVKFLREWKVIMCQLIWIRCEILGTTSSESGS